jgi:hypothetical protein
MGFLSDIIKESIKMPFYVAKHVVEKEIEPPQESQPYKGTCPNCGGMGYTGPGLGYRDFCDRCSGTGQVGES